MPPLNTYIQIRLEASRINYNHQVGYWGGIHPAGYMQTLWTLLCLTATPLGEGPGFSRYLNGLCVGMEESS